MNTNDENRLAALIQADSISAELIEEMKKAYAKEFADQHERWLKEQERRAAMYAWIPAREIRAHTVICETQGRSSRVFKYTVTRRESPLSRFDRKIRLEIDKTKLWVYDPDDLVMVRRHD